MLLCILGKSCSGKTTFVNHLEKKYGIKRVVTTTSRPMRDGEIDGVDYNFVTYEEARNNIKNGEFIEYAKYKVANNETWIYGTKISDIDTSKTSLIVLNPIGYKKLKSLYKDKVLCIYIKPSPKKRVFRILKRDKGDYKQAFIRLMNDYKDFKNVDADIIIKDFKLK